MADHSAREHAQWSASATDRNWNCPGALALTDDLPEQTNEAADWGTCCHQVSEKCLRQNKDAVDFIGTTEKGKKHSFEVDDDMADTAQMYVDYCRKRLAEYKEATGKDAIFFIEENFSLADLNPPFQAGGTGDFVIIFPLWKLIEVVDLKGGRGVVVEVKGNPQGRSYGLGAMLKHPKADIERVRVTIVQPRAAHKDGRIRSDDFHVADLVEWTTDLVAAMKRSRQALVLAQPYKDMRPDPTWVRDWLKAGDHCKFCKAAGFCPALEQRAHDAAGVWFDDLDQPRISNAPDMLSPERAAALLDAADMIGEYLNAVRAYWHAQAEGGVEIPNYILVDKEGREKWNDGAEAEAAKIAKGAGLADTKVFNPAKMRTPKQVRAELAKLKASDALAKIGKLSDTPKTGSNLVRVTKTTRPAATPAVNKHFDILE